MRLLLPVFSPALPTWGGLTRTIAVAKAALAAGHQVAFCTCGPLADDLSRHGYKIYPIPAATTLGLPRPLSHMFEQRSQQMAPPVRPGKSVGNIWLVLMGSGMAHAGYLKQLVQAEMQAVKDFQPDALFTDLDPGAFLVAAITGLPIASTYASIATTGADSFACKVMTRAANAVLLRYGKAKSTIDQICFAPSVLKIIPSIPELDDTDAARTDVRYVGQLLGEIRPPDGYMPEPGRRYVFVYTGAGSVSLNTLKTVLPQIFPADGNIICLVGAQSVETEFKLGGVSFQPYVPAEAILPVCDWIICHGGQNTIIQSLRSGVPLLIFPGAIFERRFNARKVVENGAGLMGESNEFTVDWLKHAMKHREECAAHAHCLGERIDSFGGAHEAVQAIEALSRQQSTNSQNS
jgi:hypothetical protein